MKIAYRSPLFFKHGGIWLRVWDNWYRIIKIGEH